MGIDAQPIRSAAKAAIGHIKSRRWPFGESHWQALRVPHQAQELSLPTGWDVP
jgi:hypothetical protein